uniref:BspA family leucine-rich repeat surface protein n=1 Tax=Flagellimonas onchidii TaxID=2562684 RepID=UPI0010A605D9
NIVVQISDGELTADIGVAITVKNIVETLAEDPNSFVTTWETTMANEKIAIGIDPNYTYDFTVDWGDGEIEQISISGEIGVSHFYETSGVYTVAIYGDFPAIYTTPIQTTPSNLKSIQQWGTIEWRSMNSAFRGCVNMVYNAKDVPDLSQVSFFNQMFQSCYNFNGDLSGWNLNGQNIGMGNMFFDASSFEGIGLETWNTENVINMLAMFNLAKAFNGDIGNWKTQNVTTMQNMFTGATAFDQNLGNWDISSVTNMENMLNNTAMSTDNYGNTLIGWATLDQGEAQIPTGIELGAVGLQYSCDLTPGAEDAHDTLSADPYNWNIQDESPVDCGGGL